MGGVWLCFVARGIGFSDLANRRMRARMSGGVRGGPGNPALLLDSALDAVSLCGSVVWFSEQDSFGGREFAELLFGARCQFEVAGAVVVDE